MAMLAGNNNHQVSNRSRYPKTWVTLIIKPQLISIVVSPKNERMASYAIAVLTVNIMYSKEMGNKLGTRCLKMMWKSLPPAMRAASMNGFTLTERACDLTTIAVPPKPNKSPRTIASSIIPMSIRAPSTIKMGNNGIMYTRSARRISSKSINPP